MQMFIDVIRYEDSSQHSIPNTHCVILDPRVGATLNWEYLHAKKKVPQPFDPVVLHEVLDNLLPSDMELCGCNIIMVPMHHRHHWTLYVINFTLRRIDILDPNPYGPALAGMSWADHHKNTVKTEGKKWQRCKLIVSRLTKAIQQVRPHSTIPKFGKYQIAPILNLPVMHPLSNDSGFYVMFYLKYYDFNDGQVKGTLNQDNISTLRSEILHLLTFHYLNEIKPLPAEVEMLRRTVQSEG
ncbi:hypothetical protein BS78_06G041100 [Paspalum vaginatum]|nr:hypothetical protein BS78_06G041100 [Paspalum vaginatum]